MVKKINQYGSYDYELSPAETEEIETTGYTEDFELGIAMTKDIDGYYRVYKISHNWNIISLNQEVKNGKSHL